MKRILIIVLAFSVLLSLSACGGGNENEDIFQKYYDEKVASYAVENELYQPNEVDVVFLGDSLTDAYDLQKYYPDYTVLNRGIGGDTTVGLEKRLEVSVFAVSPKAVVMLIGANNMKEMMNNYETILQKFEQNLPNSRIILLSLTSMGGDWGKNNQLAAYNNVLIKKLAEKYGFDFVDLYSPLLDPETGEIFAKYTTDGGHLTPDGYAVLTEQITPAIERALGCAEQ